VIAPLVVVVKNLLGGIGNEIVPKLLADKVGAKRLPEYGKSAIIIRAWNYFRAGKSVQILKWKRILKININ
jgi:hypothetical protein